MKLSALLLAAASASTLAPAALAQTTPSTTMAQPPAASSQAMPSQTAPQTAPSQTMPSQTMPSQTMPSGMAPGSAMNGTSSTGGDMAGAATSGGAYRPLQSNPSEDIVSLLQASGEFGTFLKIADATSLTSVLKTTPGITVFAPTDAAFAALPPASMDLKDPTNLQKLQALLTYHIVNAKVPPLAGHGATPVTTVAGSKVTLDGSGPSVKINDAKALQTQVAASNGVVYPIDKVLSPDYTPPPAAAETPAADQPATATPAKKKTTRKRHTS